MDEPLAATDAVRRGKILWFASHGALERRFPAEADVQAPWEATGLVPLVGREGRSACSRFSSASVDLDAAKTVRCSPRSAASAVRRSSVRGCTSTSATRGSSRAGSKS